MSSTDSTASSPSSSSVASGSAAQSSTVADNMRRAEAVAAADSSLASGNSGENRMAVHPADRKRRLTSTGEDVRLQRTRSGSAAGPSTTRTVLPNRSASLVLPVSRSRPSGFAAPGSSYATAIDISSSPPAPPSGLDNSGRGSRWMQASLHDNSPPRPSRHSSYASSHRNEDEGYMEFTRPQWQPDAEATSCPICATVFSFWYRKHHCRKCGRVVCASCSPHRITIPRQYIVRPPESLSSSTHLPAPSPTATPSRSPQIFDPIGEDLTSFLSTVNPALGGGEEVRLCNPCVPDPNPNPPQPYSTVRPYGHRSTQSLSSSDMGNVFSRSQRAQGDPRQSRRTVGDHDRPHYLRDWSHRMSDHAREAVHDTYPDVLVQGREMRRARRASQATAAPEAQQNLELTTHDDGQGSLVTILAPRARRRSAVSERDLCPVCGQRFLSLTEENPIEVREAHIRECIDNHAIRSTHRESPTSRQAPPVPPPFPSFVRMVKFTATEKDCLDDDGKVAECMICMEEYKVDDVLARLECLCKFHLDCLEDWFQKKSECPVHFRPE